MPKITPVKAFPWWRDGIRKEVIAAGETADVPADVAEAARIGGYLGNAETSSPSTAKAGGEKAKQAPRNKAKAAPKNKSKG